MSNLTDAQSLSTCDTVIQTIQQMHNHWIRNQLTQGGRCLSGTWGVLEGRGVYIGSGGAPARESPLLQPTPGKSLDGSRLDCSSQGLVRLENGGQRHPAGHRTGWEKRSGSARPGQIPAGSGDFVFSRTRLAETRFGKRGRKLWLGAEKGLAGWERQSDPEMRRILLGPPVDPPRKKLGV